jgi:hypothetical protein
MSNLPSQVTSHPLLRVVVYGAAIVLALLHVFVTFRGLSSATGMEQAQLAREVARGHGYTTKVIRPYAWARMEASGKTVLLEAMPEITQPPLQPLILAPIFKLLERHQLFDPAKGGSIYLLDRVIACLGVTCLLLTLVWTHGAARRLFDDTVASFVVLILLVCEPLWQLAVSGSPVALLLPLFALTFRFLAVAQIRLQDGQGIMLQALLIGLLAGLLIAAAFTLPGKRMAVVIMAALPVAAYGAWGWWLTRECGDALGGAKTLFQSHLLSMEPSLLQREFSITTQPVAVDDLLRKVSVNWRDQLSQGFAHLGLIVPAAAFFAALLHRFRRRESARSCHALAIMLGAVSLGMGFLGLPDETADDQALYIVLAPAMSIFGTAMLAVLWSRLHGSNAVSFWARLGFGVIAVAVSAIPMAAELPAQVKLGLTLRGRLYPHWPPYVPDRVSFMRRLTEPNEIIFSDAPWFVAWYADVRSVWLPVRRSDFAAMTQKAESAGTSVAGIVVTPLSSKVNHLHEAFSGPYREWPDLIFRGPMLALDREFLPYPDFRFIIPLPLMVQNVGTRETLSMQMTFYTDKVRKPKN